MRPIILDTNAYTAFKLGNDAIIEIIRHTEVIGMSPIVLGELISGFDHGNKSKKNREELQQFLNSSRIRIFPITEDTSLFYSRVYMNLKCKGKPIPTNDMWIAAQTMEHGCVLCSYDKHFKSIEGLTMGTTCSELMI